MSISTFLGLQTALRGLTAQQQALDVAGHNIANSATPGYSRQSAVLVAAPALHLTAGAVATGAGALLGTGVDIAALTRARDGFLDLQYRAQAMQLGDASTRAALLAQAQTALSEPSDDGLAAGLQSFWNAWGALANTPTSAPARQVLLDGASDLAAGIRTLDGRLAALQQQAAQQSSDLLGPSGVVHSAATELASLNDSIASAAARGESPNDLLDRRDLLLDQLSSLAQVSVTPSTARPGALTVLFGGSATPLVDGDVTGQAAVAAWPPVLGSNPGGELGALGSLADTVAGPLASLRADLSTVAATLVSAVNNAYTAGGTLPGALFSATAGNEAATIAVDPSVTVAGLRAGTGAAGSNDIALAVSALRDAPAGASDLYGAFVARVGSTVANAQHGETVAQSLGDAVDARRQSVSGVSMDEEMTSLIRFQRGYQASARVLTTMDDMLDHLINRTGIVGL